jgi:hypothetical protein
VGFCDTVPKHHQAEHSKRVASEASKILRDMKAPAIAKSVAGSALTQVPDRAPKRSPLYPEKETNPMLWLGVQLMNRVELPFSPFSLALRLDSDGKIHLD